MADVNPIFNIDAGLILAKLHAAGRQQMNDDKAVLINTGIADDKGEKDPKNIGNQKFQFRKSGKYEVGLVVKIEDYVPTFEELDSKYEESLSQNSSNIADDKQEEFAEALKKENEKRKKDKEKLLNDIKKDVFKKLETYFINFVGKDNCKNLKQDSLAMIPFAETESISDVDIKPEDGIAPQPDFNNKVMEELKEEFKTSMKEVKEPKDIESVCADSKKALYYCFKVAYTATLETA